MKAGWTLVLVMGLMGCQSNTEVPLADLASLPPDLGSCPVWPAHGGGGQSRPQVLLPAGTATIEGVTFPVASFAMDVFLVTVGGYRDCVAAGACTVAATSAGCNWTSSAGAGEAQPLNCASWAQASTFCQWAGRRLPTEEEWQYAAGNNTYPWGDDAPVAAATDGGAAGQQLCWSSNSGTCPVGSYPALLFGARSCGGLADLAGDVSEWTASEYHDPYTHPAPACNGASLSCSIRGGAWNDFIPSSFRASLRDSSGPAMVFSDIGFRCARTP